MRKSIKKIVASVVAGAMALAMMVTPSVDAYATTTEKTVHITVNGDTSAYSGVLVQMWNGVTTEGAVAIPTYSDCWGAENAATVSKITLEDGKADLKITVDTEGDGYGVYTGGQLICYTTVEDGNDSATTVNTGNAQEDLMAAFNDAGTEFWLTFTLPDPEKEGDKGSYSVSITDPAAKTATELCIDAINAIGTVTLDSKSKIEAAEAAYAALKEDEKKEVTNYATLTKARTDYDALKKAEDEKNEAAAGDLTVYVKMPAEWTGVKIYGWTSAGELFGKFPGADMTACEGNKGYYKATIKTNGVSNLIFVSKDETAPGNAKGQSDNIEGLAAGTYWFDLTIYEKGDINGRTGYTVKSSTKAPEGWVEEKKAEIETQETTTKAETESKEEETTTAPDASAWEDALLKIHFLNSMEWEKVGVYLTYGSWAQLTGAWPGSEMQLEDGSETWYAVCTNADAEDTYNVIFNNMVSDAQADAGEAKKEQTPDTTGLAAGEYWFVLGEVTAETDKQITYGVTMFDSVEALEEAGYEYDGNGLVGDVAVEDENEDADEEDADEEDADEEETTAEKADGATTGDAAPIAVVLLGMVAVVAVVASKKRQNA